MVMTGLLLDKPRLTPNSVNMPNWYADAAIPLSPSSQTPRFLQDRGAKCAIERYSFDLRQGGEQLAELLGREPREADRVILDIRLASQPLLRDVSAFAPGVRNLFRHAIKSTHSGHLLIAVHCDGWKADIARMRLAVPTPASGSTRRDCPAVPEIPQADTVDHAPLRLHRARSGDLEATWLN